MRPIRSFLAATLAVVLAAPAGGLAAQVPATDPSDRLREVLPADVAERVLARIAAARARELPAQALENRALKYAARGVAPAQIERAIAQHADRMGTAKGLLEAARPTRPAGEEIDAAAEAMRQGVDGAAVSAVAKAAPSGRSLAVPLFVLGSLVERGLPADSALARVRDRLQARAGDGEIEALAERPGNAAGNAGARGLERAAAARGQSGGAGGGRPPAGVPQNPGKAGGRGRPGSGGPPSKVPPAGRP